MSKFLNPRGDGRDPNAAPKSFSKPRRGRFSRIMGNEDGVVTVDFLIMLPLLFVLFLASFESGMFMTRKLMLERAVDGTMRSLRLGLIDEPDADKIKDAVCQSSAILTNCRSQIRVELRPIDTITWAMPSTSTECVDRTQDIQPALEFNPGRPNEVMLVRVCVIQDALFPGTGVGLNFDKEPGGGYRIMTSAAFVNEP